MKVFTAQTFTMRCKQHYAKSKSIVFTGVQRSIFLQRGGPENKARESVHLYNDCISVYLSISQYISVYLSISQCISVYLSVSQYISVLLSVSQCISVYLSVSQCILTLCAFAVLLTPEAFPLRMTCSSRSCCPGHSGSTSVATR